LSSVARQHSATQRRSAFSIALSSAARYQLVRVAAASRRH